MSSKYPVLDNRPIDQWKVTELKEELKRRKLVTKGLKDDLIRRLDDALRVEMESAAAEVAVQNENDSSKEEDGKGSNCDPEPQIEDGDVKTTPMVEDTRDNGESITQKVDEMVEDTRDNGESVTQKVDEMVEDTRDNGESVTQKVDEMVEDNRDTGESVTQKVDEMVEDTTHNGENITPKVDESATTVDINDSSAILNQGNVQEGKPIGGFESAGVVEEPVVLAVSVEINTSVSETVVTEIEPSVESQNNENQVKNEDPKHPHEDDVLNVSDSNNQVSEVSPILGFQVKCESISTDSVSIIEKNELKDSLNADNFHLELEVVKPEKVEPSSSDIPPNGGDIPPLDEQVPREKQSSIAELDDTNATNVDLSKKIDSADGGSSEKLNLDRSPGDDSMEEDVMDSKHIESNHSSDEVVDRSEVPIVKEESPVDVTSAALSSDKKDVSGENKNSVAVPAEKRKLEDKVVESNEPPKRQRRWNSETLKVPDPSTSVPTPTTTPKETFPSTIPRRNFTRSDSTVSGADTPKERVVPPSSKPPTNSLRIDRFLRPFTLKAVQELLAKTGTVSSFWMDHIKTHCYVTYSSAEEAKETRNALYNLQWPPNGGRLLVAEFVDPQEVKMRAQAPSQSPAAPVSTTPTTPAAPQPFQSQPSPRQHAPKEQLPPPPPLPLPPPPPLTNPPAARERLTLPPPPPLTTKTELPILTLDDLFRKTRATPRIYYLPLSEEQVAVKLASQGKNTK